MTEERYRRLIPLAKRLASRYRLDDWQDLLHDALVEAHPDEPTADHLLLIARRSNTARRTRTARWSHFNNLADPSWEPENIGRVGAPPALSTARKRVDALARGRAKIRRRKHGIPRTNRPAAADALVAD